MVMEELRLRLPVADDTFDRIFPPPIREMSRVFWTPVRVAQRALTLLELGSGMRLLDIGAGVGKFCFIGAAVTDATFVGLEHRQSLVDIARAAIEELSIPRVRIEMGGLETISYEGFDALYLYNPFEENLSDENERIDAEVSLSQERFCQDVRFVEGVLARAARGTRVVTYHGFGGSMPRTYRLRVSEQCGTGALRLWVKDR
jgi:hypothetical protein